MSDILIIFGSKSDASVYEKLASNLNEKAISFQLRISSAHKSPEQLKEIISQSNARIIIAGAGLSAALPGVIASQTLKPVIGLPVRGNFEGLDALLSIFQMPSGIPVLGVGVEDTVSVVTAIEKMLKLKTSISLKRNDSKAFEKARVMLERFKVPFSVCESNCACGEEVIHLDFISLGEVKNAKAEGLTVFVPVAEKEKAVDAVKLLEVKNGLWVGLNRGDNAALAAIEILNLNNAFKEKLESFREELKEKIAFFDQEEKVRFG